MRGRYAPSPTGDLHLGNLRTALLAWLFARSAGSEFAMRVEDLDTGRVREEYVGRQLDDLAALGLDWDGPAVRQSERLGLYEEAIARLDAEGLLYPCFCTRREIREAASAPHGSLPEGAYPGTCRELTAAERRAREAAGRPPALRVRAAGHTDDFVVRRNDGVPAYNLAVIVDDAAQGVEEVVRGADLASSTPRQLLLADLLELEPPRSYVHVPLMLGPDGTRLAKRHGAVTLGDQLADGRTPEEVRTELARGLGLATADEEVVPLEELLRRFDPVVTRRARREADAPSVTEGSP